MSAWKTFTPPQTQTQENARNTSPTLFERSTRRLDREEPKPTLINTDIPPSERKALKILVRNRVEMDYALRSAMKAVASGCSGRKKIDGGEVEFAAPSTEIERRILPAMSVSDLRYFRRPFRDRDCSSGSSSLSLNFSLERQFPEVEMLRRKMERASSEEILGRVAEELSTVHHRCYKERQFCGIGHLKTCQPKLASAKLQGCGSSNHDHYGSGKKSLDGIEKDDGGCFFFREVVKRVEEQVNLEVEQWEEMQELLYKLQLEMEELGIDNQRLRQYATASHIRIQSLHSQMLEWKQRAEESETKVAELKKQLYEQRHRPPVPPLISSRDVNNISTTASFRSRPQRRRSIVAFEHAKLLHEGEEENTDVLSCHVIKNTARSPLTDIVNKPSRLGRV